MAKKSEIERFFDLLSIPKEDPLTSEKYPLQIRTTMCIHKILVMQENILLLENVVKEIVHSKNIDEVQNKYMEALKKNSIFRKNANIIVDSIMTNIDKKNEIIRKLESENIKLRKMIDPDLISEIKNNETFIKNYIVSNEFCENVVKSFISTFEQYKLVLGSTETMLYKNINARCKEDKEKRTLEWWQNYFSFVLRCPFLLGKANNNNWSASLDWLLKKENIEKVLSGKYCQNKTIVFAKISSENENLTKQEIKALAILEQYGLQKFKEICEKYKLNSDKLLGSSTDE